MIALSGRDFSRAAHAGKSTRLQPLRECFRTRDEESDEENIRRLTGPASGVYSGGYDLGQLLLRGIVGFNFFFAAAQGA